MARVRLQLHLEGPQFERLLGALYAVKEEIEGLRGEVRLMRHQVD